MPQTLNDSDVSKIIMEIMGAAATFEERVYALQEILHPRRRFGDPIRGVRGWRGGKSMTNDQILMETKDSIRNILSSMWTQFSECVEYIRSPSYEKRIERTAPEPETTTKKVSRFRLAVKGEK